METIQAPLARLSQASHAPVLKHYRLALPLMVEHFRGTPMIYAAYPHGLGNYTVFHGPLHAPPKRGLPTIDVRGAHGIHTYPQFSESAIQSALASPSTVEFHGWGCTAGDPLRPRFARILLELDAPNHGALEEAASILRDRLAALHLQAIALLQGPRNAALWIPLSLAPSYVAVRAWLHRFCAAAAAGRPNLFSLEPNTIASGRVHLHVGTNAPGRYSALPYSLHGDERLRVCTPIVWEELEACAAAT